MEFRRIGFSAVPFLLVLLFSTQSFSYFFEPASPDYSLVSGATAETEAMEDVSLNRKYLWGYAEDTIHIAASPAGWGRREWFTAAAAVGTAAGLYYFDQNVKNWTVENKNGTTQKLADFGNHFGVGYNLLPGLGAFYLYGVAVDDSRAKRAALLSVESFFIGGFFSTAVKYATHRQRPADGDRYDNWDGPALRASDMSFCSGHATAAFSVMTVIATEYRDKPLVPPIAYGLALLTALSRIHDGAHWTSDAFVGSAIGYFTAKAIMSLHRKKTNFAVMPAVGGRHAGISIIFSF